ncbi:MAG: hypothetical protein PHO91_00670 [Patescibacteria group bacterium]|nr:hypothetical protein [Patescibacteria group bacterium]
MTQNIIIQALKSLILDLVAEILYFPLWWYGAGLKQTIVSVFRYIKRTARDLALPLLFKSMFKPMFGQYDREGRIISFFMRIVITFSKLIVFFIASLLYLITIVLWVALPPLVVWGLIANFSALWK